MKGKKEDRRIGRTRRMMHEALMALIVEKGYESVTVQDILDRADLGRSTFYSHYRNKDELLLSGFDHLRAMLEKQYQGLKPSEKGGTEAGFNLSLEFFRHAGQNLRLYKAIVGRESGQLIMRYIHRYLFDLARGRLADAVKNRKTAVRTDAAAHWLVSSFLSLLTWWLDNNLPVTAEQIDAMFRKLTMPGLDAALGIKAF